jgi:ATP-dependent protease HslVU (ClpYQ) peptidase subunit
VVAFFEDGLVFGVGSGGFLAVAAREAGVDFVVESAADGFADALGACVSGC